MELKEGSVQSKKVRNFPTLDLSDQSTLSTSPQPVLVIQSPKTPTLSRKLKAVSLDSDPQKQATSLEVSRDVFSMPNTPKKQIKAKLSCDFDDGCPRATLAPSFSSNLKKFASNNSISGSQTLKTLPEIMTLQDFSDNPTEPVRIKPKGLLERRGSNASLTIDLGSNSSISESKPAPLNRLNTAKSVSNLNLSAISTMDKCICARKFEASQTKATDRRKSQETCGNCIIYESVPSKISSCLIQCQTINKRCTCCVKTRRKSLSNENLYVPPCGFCQTGAFRECPGTNKHCKGYRKAFYPRQPDLESAQLLSEDFKLHLQNMQYLQNAGHILTMDELKQSCEMSRVPKLHQEFWEVPLNLQEKCYVSGSQSMNRYRSVLPNEHSRVHLPGPQTYIHANYIKGPENSDLAYVATQGPMTHTCQDFWEMVWFTNCKCVVMLTNLVEKGRNKCELYFPLGRKSSEKPFLSVKTAKVRDVFTFDCKNTKNQLTDELIVKFEKLNEVTFGQYIIRHQSTENLSGCQVRQLELRKQDHPEVRIIHHYWYPDWPDHKMANPEQVLQIAMHVLNLTDPINKNDNKRDISNVVQKAAESHPHSTKFNYDLTEVVQEDCTPGLLKGKLSGHEQRKRSIENVRVPVVVHCSAGIGRTGCFLAVLNGIQQLRTNFDVDVLGILCSLRLNRGGMVQTAEQYELIHRVLRLYAESNS